MLEYIWQGVNTKGVKRKGKMEADNEKQVEAMLKRIRITPTKIKPAPKDLFEGISFLSPKVTANDLMVFTRQFSTMIDAGLPLVSGLEVLAEQQENKTFKTILRDINSAVQSGATLSEAMKKYPKLFDDLYTNLVAAGEEGGILDTVLQRLAEYIEKAQKLKRMVKSALMYPIIVTIVAVLVIVVIMVFVIPVFQSMFADFGQALPMLTQVVVSMSNFTKSNIIYMILAGGVLGYAVKRFINTEKGRVIFDRASLQAPIFGDLLRKVAVARFTRTLSTMMSSGVPIMNSLEIVAKTAGNKIVEEAVMDTRTAISEGRSIADPLNESGVFPSMVVHMISIGEEVGALDSMLEKIADFYDDEVEAAVDGLTSMIEPLLMVFL
ncbi:MAG: type II secretion system F family protein, partial [Thermodesulfobacteriota bacterium]|nr:type II secretion system F family protein [Thermodesulfobacteriota bacterium]